MTKPKKKKKRSTLLEAEVKSEEDVEKVSGVQGRQAWLTEASTGSRDTKEEEKETVTIIRNRSVEK